jgi:hypothetical protein
LIEEGGLSGITDWADIAAGDRATDLASIWMLSPTVESRESARSEYENVSSATWFRAIAWAVQARPDLCGHSKIDSPNFASPRIGHLLALVSCCRFIQYGKTFGRDGITISVGGFRVR